jgi:predicted ATP-grasp superfamily ATP-dependent carboligase
VRANDVNVLLPITDVTTMLVAGHRDAFASRCHVPLAPLTSLQRAADKVRLLETATQLGVPAPRSHVVERSDDPLDFDLPFPVVIKPHGSRVRAGGGWRACSVRYAADAQALREDLVRRHPAEFPILIQERIAGQGLGLFACYGRNHAPVAVFGHRRLREKPPWGGVSVMCEAVPVAPRVLDYAQRLLGALDWYGVAMVEFKEDQRDGVPKLMEINGRFWGSLQLAIDAGVDFPSILVETAIGRPPAALPEYTVGVKSRWFWGDVDALMLQMFSGRTTPAWFNGHGRKRAILDFLRLWEPGLRYENPRLSDVRPWVFETLQWLKGSVSGH